MSTAVLEKPKKAKKAKETKKAKVPTLEPLLTGDLNDRFYKAVHEKAALYYDVVQTGHALKNLRRENGLCAHDGSTPYEIVLLHGDNVTDNVLGKMMALQDKIAQYPYSHADNKIDYKTEDEVIEHYSTGGLGLGIFTVSGEMIGQVMLSFKNLPTAGLSGKDDAMQADIGWLMVDNGFRGNLLCQSLIGLAVQMAESSNMTQISANVRAHNPKGMAVFASKGFVAAGAGENGKDGSPHVKLYKIVQDELEIGEESYPRPLSLNLLQEQENRDLLNKLASEERTVAKWDFTSKWFTVHSYSVKDAGTTISGQKPTGNMGLV